MQRVQDVDHRHLVFIRFNPDEYTTSTESIKSCWGYNTTGLCVVKKSAKKEWDERLDALSKQIQYWYENRTDKTVEVVQLFYNTN